MLGFASAPLQRGAVTEVAQNVIVLWVVSEIIMLCSEDILKYTASENYSQTKKP